MHLLHQLNHPTKKQFLLSVSFHKKSPYTKGINQKVAKNRIPGWKNAAAIQSDKLKMQL